MFKQLQIKNFRSFQSLSLENLKAINLISGKNNIGKSTILESIFLLCEHAAPRSFGDIQGLRGYSLPFTDTYVWDSLFYNIDNNKSINISGKYDNSDFVLEYSKDENFIPGSVESNNLNVELAPTFIEFAKERYSLKFVFKCDKYFENGHFLLDGKGTISAKIMTPKNDKGVRKMPVATFVNADVIARSSDPVNWIGKLQISNKVSEVVKILKIIEPNLEDIVPVTLQNRIYLYGRVGNTLLPLKLNGAGLNQLIFLVMAIMNHPRAIVLIDEIETGFHYSIYQDLWKIIAELAKKYECQIIATTHSYECIKAAHTSMKEISMQDKFMFYRLAKDSEYHTAHPLNDELLGLAIKANLEVR